METIHAMEKGLSDRHVVKVWTKLYKHLELPLTALLNTTKPVATHHASVVPSQARLAPRSIGWGGLLAPICHCSCKMYV